MFSNRSDIVALKQAALLNKEPAYYILFSGNDDLYKYSLVCKDAAHHPASFTELNASFIAVVAEISAKSPKSLYDFLGRREQ